MSQEPLVLNLVQYLNQIGYLLHLHFRYPIFRTVVIAYYIIYIDAMINLIVYLLYKSRIDQWSNKWTVPKIIKLNLYSTINTVVVNT